MKKNIAAIFRGIKDDTEFLPEKKEDLGRRGDAISKTGHCEDADVLCRGTKQSPINQGDGPAAKDPFGTSPPSKRMIPVNCFSICSIATGTFAFEVVLTL